ncbi:hypothetical protein R3P38DRAFT_3447212 [Favolaschia claudopus]|uniref:F-box domain-containing protein n=1 Tax=Favolaschia claudopus TaxID=2862362 RepID=A0AAW0CTB1_9AGAR
MSTIPQELVEAILTDFDAFEDRDSLKSISLTALNFTGPAQRVLFRSLELDASGSLLDQPDKFERALELFQNSPHIAAYPRNLTIRLPLQPAAVGNTLKRLLPHFTQVRRFIFDGLAAAWDDLPDPLQSALTDFLLSSPLEKLHIMHISGIPLEIVTSAVRTNRVLSLQDVDIDEKVSPDDETQLSNPQSKSPPQPCLTHLMLASPDEIQPLLLKELVLPSYTANLQRLAVDHSDSVSELLRAVSPTLTELSLNCTGTTRAFTLPVLPCLIGLEIQVSPSWESIVPFWLPDTLADLSTSDADAPATLRVPSLYTLTLRIALPLLDAFARKQDLALPGTPRTAAVLAAVDAVLCGAVSLCVWELAMAGGRARNATSKVEVKEETQRLEAAAHCALVFARFRAAVERNVARMSAEGTLEVRFAERLGYGERLS